MRTSTKPATINSPISRTPVRAERTDDSHAALALAVLGEFRLIFKSARKHFNSVQDRAGVSGAQLWVLSAIDRTPGMRVTELAKSMSIHQSTASNLVERLERNKLIVRQRDDEDQRVVRLQLTTAGKKIVAKAPGPPEGILPHALKQLSFQDLLELRAKLVKLTGHLVIRDARGKTTPLSEM